MRSITVVFALHVYPYVMQTKLYTQFQVDDSDYQDSNLFSGIVELQTGRSGDISEAEIQYLLAKNFDIEFNQVHLVSWCRLH